MKTLNSIPQYSVANILMMISVVFTALTFLPLGIYKFGMNSFFFDQGLYHIWIVQMFSSQFLHGGILHLAMNTVFILYFGNALERMIGSEKFFLFFVLNSIFLGIFLTVMNAGNTVGISGFALAVLSYYTLQLKSLHHPEWTGGATAIIINIVIGLSPGISFLGHFGGMLFGVIFWYITQRKR